MKTFGNILWLILTGFWAGIIYGLLGVVWCITLIGIPLGLQYFKLAKLMFWPFGKVITTNFEQHPFANVIWAIFCGLGLSLGFFIVGAVWCITIIGIPFGKQCFKLAKLSFIPFGATIE